MALMLVGEKEKLRGGELLLRQTGKVDFRRRSQGLEWLLPRRLPKRPAIPALSQADRFRCPNHQRVLHRYSPTLVRRPMGGR